MSSTKVIAIFDIGKTNKKLFLFDEDYRIVFEKSIQLNEIKDEDGFPCEDIDAVKSFIHDSLLEVIDQRLFEVIAINFSTYGASFVLLDENNEPITPLYNYLKPYPSALARQLHGQYGGEEMFSIQTASPSLGSLNSGLQLYRIANQHPELFSRVRIALHLPQFVSSLITRQYFSDITSIGCHTAMWNFQSNTYHQWITDQGIAAKLAPVVPGDTCIKVEYGHKELVAGIGLHDSSAALIPYLLHFTEPFILISTGTWCISLNPFNNENLTAEELKQDCLCYYSFDGRPVKSSRLFGGNEHEQQVKILADHFAVPQDYYKVVSYNEKLMADMKATAINFSDQSLSSFKTYEEAYHSLMWNITNQQLRSTSLILTNSIKRIFVDGGFSQNQLYMNMLARLFTGAEVYAASMAQATALGAALAIHKNWNTKSLRNDLIELKYFSDRKQALNI